MEDSRSSASSTSSLSEPGSPEASVHQYDPPSLERLVQHFVHSKRSLSSAGVVWRANELVNASRSLLEEIAVLNARNSFARRGIDEQTESLRVIRGAISESETKAGDEFRSTIDNLDVANERLEQTLRNLRDTIVDPSLSKQTSLKLDDAESRVDEDDDDEDDDDDDGHERNLYSFIDETRHEDLRSSLRTLIDSFNDARDSLDNSISYFDGNLQNIAGVLAAATRRKDPDMVVDKATIYDEPPQSTRQLFNGMESHAQEMANLLESLVSHYDLCMTALKHTEGGGAAAKSALQAEQLSKDPSELEESLYIAQSPVAMDEEERAALLQVLEKDALEVADVVEELKDHAASIERSFEQLSQSARLARGINDGIKSALGILHEMQQINLPAHLLALTTFRSTWQTIQTAILGKMEELVALRDFNESFLNDYNKLLREVERRSSAADQIRKIAAKANKEIKKLVKADADSRAEFMEDVGKYLPNDLWPAMKTSLPVWTVSCTKSDG